MGSNTPPSLTEDAYHDDTISLPSSVASFNFAQEYPIKGLVFPSMMIPRPCDGRPRTRRPRAIAAPKSSNPANTPWTPMVPHRTLASSVLPTGDLMEKPTSDYSHVKAEKPESLLHPWLTPPPPPASSTSLLLSTRKRLALQPISFFKNEHPFKIQNSNFSSAAAVTSDANRYTCSVAHPDLQVVFGNRASKTRHIINQLGQPTHHNRLQYRTNTTNKSTDRQPRFPIPTMPVTLRAYEQWRLRRSEFTPPPDTRTTTQSTANNPHQHNSRAREQDLLSNTMNGTLLEQAWHLSQRGRQLDESAEARYSDSDGPAVTSSSTRWEWLFPCKRNKRKKRTKKKVVYQGYSGDWTF
ncbi:hypothetical protein NP233_g10360 [Leucocoprinus birnbaumii]|uniref:Uncharacterized protein n=1 Tax=Leucocoprinus birnbaumii TaxID=56174 RepID=A0AAD5YM86_9AGAR|nr:hypothetical protein NP233_g10360 [Leucocoprinus birnbaumii]